MKTTSGLNSRGETEAGRESETLKFARRVLIANLVVASVALVLLLVWYAADLLMLVFAGLLAPSAKGSRLRTEDVDFHRDVIYVKEKNRRRSRSSDE